MGLMGLGLILGGFNLILEWVRVVFRGGCGVDQDASGVVVYGSGIYLSGPRRIFTGFR